MSFFYDRDDRTVFPDNVVEAGGEQLGFIEGVRLGYDVQKKIDNLDAYSEGQKEIYAPIVDIIADRSGETFINPGNYFGGSSAQGHNEQMSVWSANQIIGHIKDNPDLYPEDEFQSLTFEGIDALIKERAVATYEDAQEASKHGTAMGTLGQFIGAIGASVTDDALAELAIIGGPASLIGKSLGVRSLASSAMRGAVIGMSAEAAIQTGVMDWYDTLGLDYGWEQFVLNVAAGGVIGGGLPVAGRAVKLGFGQMKRGITTLERAGRVSPDEAALAKLDIDEAELEADVPEGVADATEHLDNLVAATADLEVGRAPNNPNMPTVEDPLPTVADIDDADPTNFTVTLDDVPDDEVFEMSFSDGIGGGTQTRSMTGAEIKEAARQDQSMLDRLEGCVVK